MIGNTKYVWKGVTAIGNPKSYMVQNEVYTCFVTGRLYTPRNHTNLEEVEGDLLEEILSKLTEEQANNIANYSPTHTLYRNLK